MPGSAVLGKARGLSQLGAAGGDPRSPRASGPHAPRRGGGAGVPPRRGRRARDLRRRRAGPGEGRDVLPGPTRMASGCAPLATLRAPPRPVPPQARPGPAARGFRRRREGPGFHWDCSPGSPEASGRKGQQEREAPHALGARCRRLPASPQAGVLAPLPRRLPGLRRQRAGARSATRRGRAAQDPRADPAGCRQTARASVGDG